MLGLYPDVLLDNADAGLIAAGYLAVDELAGFSAIGVPLPVEDRITPLAVERIVRQTDGRGGAVVADDGPTTGGSRR